MIVQLLPSSFEFLSISFFIQMKNVHVYIFEILLMYIRSQIFVVYKSYMCYWSFLICQFHLALPAS